MFGDNWLILEGTPLDGSRTIYFDAARATLEVKKWKTTFDGIFIDQAARNNSWLPPIRVSSDAVNGVELPVKKAQIEHDERGAVLYMVNRSNAKRQIDAYFIYKGTRRIPQRVLKAADARCALFEVTSDADAVDDAGMGTNLCRGENADLYTVGTRVAGELAPTLKYRVEGAYQTGTRNDRNQRAFGLNSALTFAPKTKRSHQFRMTYEFLQGDDPNTGRDEGFDILWGRWPRWSELYIYTYAIETRISQLGNLHRFGPGWSFKPWSKADFSMDLNRILTDENNRPVGVFAAAGRGRGTLLQAKLLMRNTSHLSTHVWAERFWPGSYYAAARQDPALFVRAEALLTW
jgi:hypothetical protein